MVNPGTSFEEFLALQHAYRNPKSICYSGGAKGADKLWGEVAAAHGHDVCHFTFSGHGAATWATGRKLTDEELAEADPFLLQAGKILKRPNPLKRSSEFVRNLLKRNYWQIRDTRAVYAIANLDGVWQVHGGTAWAVQMFVEKMWKEAGDVFTFGEKWIPLYTFDQEAENWYQYNLNLGFQAIAGKPPAPSGPWTGIGSRPENLTPAGIKVIETIFD